MLCSLCTVADIVSKEERGAAMAKLGGLMMFGYAGGPPIGAALGALAGAAGFSELRAPFMAGALVCVAAFGFVYSRMPTVKQVRAAKAAEASAAASEATAGGGAVATSLEEAPVTLSGLTLTALGLLLLSNLLGQISVGCTGSGIPTHAATALQT